MSEGVHNIFSTDSNVQLHLRALKKGFHVCGSSTRKTHACSHAQDRRLLLSWLFSITCNASVAESTMIGRTAVAAWLALSGSASAFTTTPATTSSFSRVGTATFATANEAAVDVSIPYDAAARLAYDDWRKEYNKGAFDAKRYEAFRANYNAITIANVSAKKKARDTGDEPRLMSMNEYGDCTAEEYQAAQEKQKEGVLDKAVEAVESQSAASTALGDAAAALAEEEEVSTIEHS